MQYGIDPGGSSISSCSFTYHRLFFASLFRPSTTIPRHTSQVCVELNCLHHCNLTRDAFHVLPPVNLVTIVQVADFSVCNVSWSGLPPMLNMYAATPRFIVGAALLALAVIRTVTQSVNMYKAAKQWQPNRYMQQLVRDGALYVLVYVAPLSIPFPFDTIMKN